MITYAFNTLITWHTIRHYFNLHSQEIFIIDILNTNAPNFSILLRSDAYKFNPEKHPVIIFHVIAF